MTIQVAPNIKLTDDDKQWLLDVYRHQMIDTKMARLSAPHRSQDKVSRRLGQLAKAGYLHFPTAQNRLEYPGGGSYPHIYTLGNEGARWLADTYELGLRRDRWRTTGERLKPLYLQHTLENARFMIQLRENVKAHSDKFGFEYPHEIYKRLKPELLAKSRLPDSISAKMNWYGWYDRERTKHDGLACIRYWQAPANANSRYLFIEIDRSTETVAPVTDRNLKGRRFFNGNSFLRKGVVYASAFEQGEHINQYGISTFQVLSVMQNPGHVSHTIEQFQKHLAGRFNLNPIRFLFTDWQTISSYGDDLLQVPLRDMDNQVRSLAEY